MPSRPAGPRVAPAGVADNLNMAVYFLVLLKCVGSAFFRTHYTHPPLDRVEQLGKGGMQRPLQQPTGAGRTFPKDIAMNLMYAVVGQPEPGTWGHSWESVIPADGGFAKMGNTFFSSQYVWITLFSMLFATFFEKRRPGCPVPRKSERTSSICSSLPSGVPASIPKSCTTHRCCSCSASSWWW